MGMHLAALCLVHTPAFASLGTVSFPFGDNFQYTRELFKTGRALGIQIQQPALLTCGHGGGTGQQNRGGGCQGVFHTDVRDKSRGFKTPEQAIETGQLAGIGKIHHHLTARLVVLAHDLAGHTQAIWRAESEIDAAHA